MACHLHEERVMILFTWISLLLFLPVSVGETGSLQCPSLVQVELGTDGVIACNISFEFKNLYWYKGESFSDYPPIIRFQDGVPEKGDDFEITPDGALVILNADLSREGIYTVVVFRLNTQHEFASVFLKTFANPEPYFPLFRRCNGEQYCSLKADNNGSVQCTIQDARPAFQLDLQSEGLTLVNVTQQNFTDKRTGLTETVIKAYYALGKCVQLSNITCIASGIEKQEMKSILTFKDKCSPVSSMEPPGKRSAGATVAIILVIIVVAIFFAVATACFIKKRRYDYQQVKQADEYSNSDGRGHEKKTTIKENKNVLLNALSEKYRADYNGTFEKSNDGIISIDDVYIDTSFEVKSDDGITSTFGISEMLKNSFMSDGKMRLFVSNKMQLTFVKRFAYLWSEKKSKDKILLVFNMRDVTCHTTITSALKEMLQDAIPLNENDLFKIIEQFGCHIILEGVELKQIESKRVDEDPHDAAIKAEESVSFNTGRKDELHPSSQWTFDNILRDYGSENEHKNITHWTVTFEQDCILAENRPYTIVKMKDISLFTDHIDVYIHDIVDHYFEESSGKDKQQLIKEIDEVLQNGDIKKKFGKAVILLLQIIHLIVKKCIINNESYDFMPISELIKECLKDLKERYFRKFPTKDKDVLKTFEEQLGEIAYNRLLGKTSSKQTHDDVINFGKSIGLMKANEINFNVSDVECFLIASFLKNQDTLSDFIATATSSEGDESSEKRHRVLPFICALQPSSSHEICETLLKRGNMKYFLNCFYETQNADNFQNTVKKYLKKEGYPIRIYGEKSHLAKIRCLLKYCKNSEIKVNQVRFERKSQSKANITVVKTEAFEMPEVETITFEGIELDDEERSFVYYIEWILNQNVKEVWFDNCTLPKFAPEITLSLKSAFRQSKSAVVIRKKEKQEGTMTEYVLNKEEMKWDPKYDTSTQRKDDDMVQRQNNKRKDKGEPLDKKKTNKQRKNRSKSQTPDKPTGTGTTCDNLVSGQSEIKAAVDTGAYSNVKASDDKETLQNNVVEGKTKHTSANETTAEKRAGEDKKASDTIVDAHVDREKSGGASEFITVETTEKGMAAGD